MTTVRFDDVEVELVEAGTGPTVVLVHGSASDRRTWEPVQPALAEHFHTVGYSRRHHWPNPPADPDGDYSMGQHVDDLAHLIGQIGAPVDLVGHSYGGFVALQTTIHHPHLVRRQVLIEPPVVPLFLSDPPRVAELARVLVTRPRLGLGLLRFGATGLAPATRAARADRMDKALRTFGKAVLGQPSFDALSPARWAQCQANNIRAEYLSGSFDPLADDQVRAVEAPTLLLSGEDSRPVWPRLSDHLADLLPDSDHRRLPGAAHLVHEDAPEATVTAIVDFLTGR